MADYISKCRLGLMALAIVLVVVYHYKCWVGGFPWYIGMILQWGFIGVDIFFLLSGFGLTYSFRKNSIGGFYKNRLIKILPCYLLMGSILVLDRLAGGYEMSGGEILWMFSTLDYTFNHGGVDWYVSAILQLYLLFPLFYYIIVRTRMGGVILTVPIVLAVTWLCPMHWSQLAMLHRIPMFVFGIYLAMFRDTYRQQQYITIFYTLSFVGLVVCQGEDVNFLLTTLITPLLVFLLAKMHCVFDRLNIEKLHVVYKVVGNNTLQIYYGTNLALLSYDFISVGRGVKTIIFLQALIFGSYLFYWITDKANKLINKSI